jgi:hypothetical protein
MAKKRLFPAPGAGGSFALAGVNRQGGTIPSSLQKRKVNGHTQKDGCSRL